MEPIVDLAPLAESSPLAVHFAQRIKEGLVEPTRRRTFMALRATVFLVDFDSGDAVSLRFDHGRLTVHEGTIGLPSVTFGAPLRALMSLDQLRLSSLPRALLGRDEPPVGLVEPTSGSIPPPGGPASSRRGARLGARELLALYARGDLRIYGLVRHPRTVARFLRLVSGPKES